MTRLKILCFFGLSILLNSCLGDSQVKNTIVKKVEKLEDGHFEVIDAFRNGKQTTSLNGGYYTIRKDTVFTNLSQSLDSISSGFTFKNNKIVHSNDKALNFDVADMSSDTLKLLTEIRGFTFELVLLKSYKADEAN